MDQRLRWPTSSSTAARRPNRDVIKDPLTDDEVRLIHKGQLGAYVWPGGAWDTSGFEKAGGKAIFYVGVGDPAFPHDGMENWFKIWTDKIGPARRDKIGRLYQVPGWGHCGGGTGPNDGADVMLQALVNWVEHKQSPEGLVMHRGAERAKFMIPKPASSTIGVAIGPEVGAPRDFLVRSEQGERAWRSPRCTQLDLQNAEKLIAKPQHCGEFHVKRCRALRLEHQ